MAKTPLRSLGLGILAMVAMAPVRALVAPNPQSYLKDRSVLIIEGTETAGDHHAARVALAAKFDQLRALVGFRLTVVGGGNPPTDLDGYDVIVFNYWFNNQNSPPAFQNAFRAWVNSTARPRGWLGVHNSGANEAGEWNWFRDSVTAMGYRAHASSAQPGTIRRTAVDSLRNHPIMAGLPDTVRIPADEWYDFAYPAAWKDARVLYSLDENTLPKPLPPAARMDPHPSTWIRENHHGTRFFFTALVHDATGVNLAAHNDFFASLMLRGLEYAAGYRPSAPVRLNGAGLYGGRSWLHVANRTLTVASGEPYRLDLRSLDGKRLFSAQGAGGGTYSGIFPKPGCYTVGIATGSATFMQRVLVQ